MKVSLLNLFSVSGSWCLWIHLFPPAPSHFVLVIFLDLLKHATCFYVYLIFCFTCSMNGITLFFPSPLYMLKDIICMQTCYLVSPADLFSADSLRLIQIKGLVKGCFSQIHSLVIHCLYFITLPYTLGIHAVWNIF